MAEKAPTHRLGVYDMGQLSYEELESKHSGRNRATTIQNSSEATSAA